jgi:hypothetical protein
MENKLTKVRKYTEKLKSDLTGQCIHREVHGEQTYQGQKVH